MGFYSHKEELLQYQRSGIKSIYFILFNQQLSSKLKMQSMDNQHLQRQPQQPSVAESYLHSSNKMIECTNCGDYFNFKVIDQHQRECKNQVECVICFQFVKIQQLDKHEKICKMKKNRQERMGALKYNQRDWMVKDSQKTNKTEDKTNYPVIDGKNIRNSPKTTGFSKKIETNQPKIRNEQQKPQKKVEQQKPEQKQQSRNSLQKVQQKKLEKKPIIKPQLQEKPEQEQMQEAINIRHQKSLRLTGHITGNLLKEPSIPFLKKNRPTFYEQKPTNCNYNQGPLSNRNSYNTLPNFRRTLQQTLETSRQEKPQTTTTTNASELTVECIYCKEAIQSVRLNIHEVICDGKKNLDREKRKESASLRQNNKLNVNKQKIGKQRMSTQLSQQPQIKQQPQRVPQRRQLPFGTTLNPYTSSNPYGQFLTTNNAFLNIPPEKQPKQTLTESKINRIPRMTFSQQNGVNEENSDQEHEDCVICYQKFQPTSQVIKLECSHYFHDDCITPWLKKDSRCPTCKNKVVVEKK